MNQKRVVTFDNRARRHIPVVIYIPNADKSESAAVPGRWQLDIMRQVGPGFFQFVGWMTLIVDCSDENLALLRIGGELPGPHDSRLGAGDHCPPSHIALIGPPETKKARLSTAHAYGAGGNETVANRDDYVVMRRVVSDSMHGSAQARRLPGDNPHWI